MIGDRYLAVIGAERGTDTGVANAIAATELEECCAVGHLTVLVGDNTKIFSIDRAGAVIGTLHPRRVGASVAELAAGARNTGGRLLLEYAWGDYVALIDDRGRGETTLTRSPSGVLHAYVASLGGNVLLASDVDLLLACGVPARIDWQFVADHVAFPHLRGAATGFDGISELFPGESLVVSDTGARASHYWSPWRIATHSDATRARDDIARHLRDTVIECVRRSAERYTMIALELSGGLDSSIVAAGLADGPAAVHAINLVTPTSEGDERRYARTVAEHFGLPLREAPPSHSIDLTHAPTQRLPRPGILGVLRAWEQGYIDFAREIGAEAFFGGTGGDNIFCSLGSAAPAADAFLTPGQRRAGLRAIGHLTSVHGCDLWTATRLTAGQLRRHRSPARWPLMPKFIARDALPEQRPFHPWLDEPDSALPGKRAHIRSVMAAQAHLDGYGRHLVAPSIFPLLAQPVMEACFAVPSWQWIMEGRDRSLARDAFRPLLPAMIVNRQTKGMMNNYCAQIFQENRTALRPFLLDGHLADRGFLDRPAIAAYLSRTGPVGDVDFYFLLLLADIEAWLRGLIADPAMSG